jgi:hypothetical protein
MSLVEKDKKELVKFRLEKGKKYTCRSPFSDRK